MPTLLFFFLSLGFLMFSIDYFIIKKGNLAGLDRTTILPKDAKIIKLPYGDVSYSLRGNDSLPLVVFVHGIITPHFYLDNLRNKLSNNFQTLSFDLYGRGWSDSPDVKYNNELFVSQLTNLLFALKIEKKFDLIGISMGSFIVSNFEILFPERINKLVLLSPAGVRLQRSFKHYLSTIPYVSEMALFFGHMQLLANQVSNSFMEKDHSKNKLISEAMNMMKKYKDESLGFHRSLLSTTRNNDKLDDNESTYERVGKLGIKTLIVWGKNDTICHFDKHTILLKLIPQSKFFAIDDAEHMGIVENEVEFTKPIIEYLNQK